MRQSPRIRSPAGMSSCAISVDATRRIDQSRTAEGLHAKMWSLLPTPPAALERGATVEASRVAIRVILIQMTTSSRFPSRARGRGMSAPHSGRQAVGGKRKVDWSRAHTVAGRI